MEQLAGHYGIPSINLGLAVARLEKAGKLVFKGKKPVTEEAKAALGEKVLFSEDGVHPFPDTGHQVYLEAIVRGLALIKPAGKPAPHQLGEPFVADNWEQAKLVPLSRAKLSAGWTKLDPATNKLAKTFSQRLPEMWKANQPGETIQFQVRGTSASIYDLVGPDCGQVIVTLDNQPPTVRPRFDAFCTYHRLASLAIGANLTNTVHKVKLEIHPDQPDNEKILSQRNEKIDRPERFNDRAWYAGALLLVGDLVNE